MSLHEYVCVMLRCLHSSSWSHGKDIHDSIFRLILEWTATYTCSTVDMYCIYTVLMLHCYCICTVSILVYICTVFVLMFLYCYSNNPGELVLYVLVCTDTDGVTLVPVCLRYTSLTPLLVFHSFLCNVHHLS